MAGNVYNALDEIIPIVISLQYGKYFMKFQVNPDNLHVDIPSESNTVDVEGIGQIGVPSSAKLAKISIKSFFWQDKNLVPVSQYIQWVKRWQKSKLPAKLIVTRLNYSMYVSCESFWYETRAGEEKDYYYELSLQEYRPYGAVLLGTSSVDKFTEILNKIENSTAAVLVDIPRPNRVSMKEKYSTPYSTVSNDTLQTVAKKITGDSSKWKELYELNKNIANDCVSMPSFPVGTKLVLPQEWIQ